MIGLLAFALGLVAGLSIGLEIARRVYRETTLLLVRSNELIKGATNAYDALRLVLERLENDAALQERG